MFDQQQPVTPVPQEPMSAPAQAAPTAPAAPVQASVPPSSPPVSSGGRKGILIAVLVFIALLIAGGAGAAYYFFFLDPPPEKVLGEAMVAMDEIQTVQFDLTVTMEGTGPRPNLDEQFSAFSRGETAPETLIEEVPIVVTIESEGAVAMPTEGDDLFSGDVSVRLRADGEDMLSVVGTTRSIASVTYVKLDEMSVPLPAEVDGVMDVILDRWIEFDPHAFGELGTMLDKLRQEAKEEAAAKEDEYRLVFAEYLPQVIRVTTKLDAEAINGVASYHYAFDLNKEAMKGLIGRLNEVSGAEEDDEDAMDAFFASIQSPHGEVWVGKQDAYIRKVMLEWDQVSEEQDAQMHATAVLLLDKFNETVTVEAPTEADPFFAVLMELMAAASERALEAKDDDEDGLNAADEAKYGSSDENADTDGDGFKDGDEVKAGYNPNGEGPLPEVDDTTSIRLHLDAEDFFDNDSNDTTRLGETE